jgi:hypothetical protein
MYVYCTFTIVLSFYTQRVMMVQKVFDGFLLKYSQIIVLYFVTIQL